MKKQQDLGMHLVKACALCFVICVHFFLHSSFYGTPITGIRMLMMVTLRNFFMICVPLFMMASGYLCRHFVWDKKLLMRFLSIVISYLLCGGVCLLFQAFVMHTEMPEPILSTVINRLADFSAAPYGWYVEMHLGLMLMMPFLNIIVRLATRGQLRSCVLSLALLTLLPYVIPKYAFFDHWVSLYPVFYYMLGAYIGEHHISLDTQRKRTAGAIALVAIVVIFGIYNYLDCYNKTFSYDALCGYNSIVIAAMSCLFFLLAHGVSMDRAPLFIQKLLRRISSLTLPAYLLSFCFDKYAYPRLKAVYPTAYGQFTFFPVMVLFVLVCSLLSAQLIAWCANLLMKPIRRLILRNASLSQE